MNTEHCSDCRRIISPDEDVWADRVEEPRNLLCDGCWETRYGSDRYAALEALAQQLRDADTVVSQTLADIEGAIDWNAQQDLYAHHRKAISYRNRIEDDIREEAIRLARLI